MRVPISINSDRKRLMHAVKKEYHRIHRELRTSLAQLPDEEQRNVNVAQNVLRDVLTVLLHEMLPYSHYSAVELSRRLASYALSVVPIEDMEVVVAAHLEGFADFHLARTAAGTFIASDWRMDDGREQPNFPKENEK
jgi:hypothetical protein